MPNFFPGSTHQVKVRVRNSGTGATAVGGSGNINIIPDVGVIDLSSLLLMPIAPGATVEAIRDFTISPLAIPGSQNIYNISISYDGKTLTDGPRDAFMVEVAGPQTFFPIDTWEQVAPETKSRYADVACGWNAGPVRTDAHFLFGSIPTSITRATLKFFLLSGFGPQGFRTELRDPFFGLLGTEANSPPATITLDVTAVVKARGTLWVVINPAFWLGVLQFKYFGGIWNEDLANTYWPRVEVS